MERLSRGLHYGAALSAGETEKVRLRASEGHSHLGWGAEGAEGARGRPAEVSGPSM